jgi:hypothetical protein
VKEKEGATSHDANVNNNNNDAWGGLSNGWDNATYTDTAESTANQNVKKDDDWVYI